MTELELYKPPIDIDGGLYLELTSQRIFYTLIFYFSVLKYLKTIQNDTSKG
jgi:hypothetical protein